MTMQDCIAISKYKKNGKMSEIHTCRTASIYPWFATKLFLKLKMSTFFIQSQRCEVAVHTWIKNKPKINFLGECNEKVDNCFKKKIGL